MSEQAWLKLLSFIRKFFPDAGYYMYLDFRGFGSNSNREIRGPFRTYAPIQCRVSIAHSTTGSSSTFGAWGKFLWNKPANAITPAEFEDTVESDWVTE